MNKLSKYNLALIWSTPLVVLISLSVVLLRAPFSNHNFVMMKILFLSLGFASVASFIYRKIPISGVGFFLSAFIIMATGFLPWFFTYFYWIVIIFILLKEYKFLKNYFSKDNLRLTWLSCLVFYAVLTPYFSLDFSQPNNEIKLLSANLHVDSLYHTAIAAMSKVYHKVSHGLHGIQPLEYHFGSHVFMAGVSNILGITTFQAYNYFFVFSCIPFLGISFVSAAEELLPSNNEKDFFKKLAIYGFLMLGTGVLMTGSVLNRFALWTSFFESESFTISLILLSILISLLINYASETSSVLLALFICLCLGSITITKVSTGFCALGLIGSWALLSQEKWWTRSWAFRWFILLICCLLFWGLFQLINPGMSDAHFEPMQFIKTYVEFPGPFWLRIILFVLLHFIFPIAALAFFFFLYIKHRKDLTLPCWLALGIILSLVLGLAVIFLLYVQGGSGFYFSNVSMFMALPILICAPQLVSRYLPHFVTIFFLCFGVVTSFIYGPRGIYNGTKSLLVQVGQKKQNTRLSPYIEKLEEIRDNKNTLNSLVYIPRSESTYWDGMDCRKTGYLISAISERPALFGWPSKECYPFLCGPRFHSDGLCEKSQLNYTDEQLLIEAKTLGFSQVQVITSDKIRTIK